VLAMCASFRASTLIGSSGGLIITSHTNPYLFCPAEVVGYINADSHMIKNEKFCACFMRVLNSCVV